MKSKTVYHYGLDALRIVSMYMIIVTHIIGKGGLRDALLVPDNMQYFVVWGLQILTYVAVNCYALLSGFVGRLSSFRLSRLAQTWLHIFFYSFGMTVVFALLGFPLRLADWRYAFFPVVTREYWYMTAYMGLLLIQPLLNKGLAAMNRRQLGQILLLGFVLFSLLPALLEIKVLEFSLSKGFGLTWLIMMYIVGAYLAEADAKRIPTWFLWLVYLLSSLVTGFGNFFIGEIWFWYTSPSMVVASISFFLLFVKWNVDEKSRLAKVIKVLAPASLGVYLIHLHRLVERFFLYGKLTFLLKLDWYWLALVILGMALIVYCLASLIELARIRLFKKFRVNERLTFLDSKTLNES